MEKSSVVHISEQVYAYATGEDTLRVRLRTRAGDCDRVLVYYKNLYDHTAPYAVKEMQPILSDELVALYECEICVPERHFKYWFELQTSGEMFCYTSDGFIETVHETNCFYYPAINKDDIVSLPTWAKGGLIYQVFVDRFFNGDPGNDPAGAKNPDTLPDHNTFYGGDLQGIAQKLDYIKTLGADVIYLSPVFKSPTYHKYDVSDYYMVDEALGGREALAALIDKAHAMGLRVILDAVFNHCSVENPLFQDVIVRGESSPYSRWFLINSFPVNMSACNYDTFAGAVPSMPRFDTANPEVIAYLTDAALYWTKELGVDGWRLDVADEVSHTLWRELRRKLKAYSPDVLIIGEVWNHANRWLRGDEFDTVTNYKLRSSLTAFAQGDIDSAAFWDRISTNKMLYMTPLYPYLVGFMGTHDTARSATVLTSPALHMLAMAAVLTMEGMPLVYYGDEVGMEGGEDPDNRRAMRWDLTESSLAEEVRALARFRAGSDVLRKGDMEILDAGARALAFQRTTATGCLTVVLNFGADEVVVPGEFYEVLIGEAEITEGNARVPGMHYAIIKQGIMEDYIEITTPVREWTVLQQKGGTAELKLEGVAALSDTRNYPVIRVVDVRTERMVAYERLPWNGGRWKHTLRLATGMYRIETGIALQKADFNPYYLGHGDMLRNLFVGEVFVIAGQSNAAGYGKGEVIDMPQYGVSTLGEHWQLAAHPISQMKMNAANADELNCGHSAWLSLGKRILERTGVPVGLVPAALNGSGIRDWMPGTPLFENMVEKAALTGAAHLIWYQGCTDTDAPEGYATRLDELMQAVRQRLSGIALYIVQLSGTTNAARDGQGWRIVREAQRAAAVRHGAMLIPAYDLTRYSDDIHLSSQDNLLLAERVFARYTDRRSVGKINAHRGEAMVELTFTNVRFRRGGVEGVLALDEDGCAVPCEVYAEDSVLRLTGPKVGRVHCVTLAFDRLYGGKALRDEAGNCLPYFSIEV